MNKILLIILFLLTTACNSKDYAVIPVSYDNKYSIELSHTSNGILEIHVLNNNKDTYVIDTKASIYQRYAVGWEKTKNIIVMNSSDIGTKAWEVTDNGVNEIEAKDYKSYASNLYNEKYN